MNCTILLVVSNDTLADAIFHDQVSCEVFDEVLGVVTERLSVESVKESVSSTISCSTASVSLATLSKILRLTAKGTLVTVVYQ